MKTSESVWQLSGDPVYAPEKTAWAASHSNKHETRIWTISLPDRIFLQVHRHLDYSADAWFLSMIPGITMHPLKEKDIDKAKLEALTTALQWTDRLAKALEILIDKSERT